MNKPRENKPFPKWLLGFLIKFAVCFVLFFIALYVKKYFPKQIQEIHSYIQDDSPGFQTKARDFIIKYSPMQE